MTQWGIAGFAERKLGKYLFERCFSDDARGYIYEETVNAFRTHFDDNHGCFDGWVNPDHGLWQGEYWGKNMLAQIAVAKCRYNDTLRDELISKARSFVKEFQQDDGYIGTYSDREFIIPKDPAKKMMCWNLWGRKYTLWALVEIFRLSNDRYFLCAAMKLMDQQMSMLKKLHLREIDTGCFDGVASASVLKPLLLLYKESGEGRYLEHAREIVASMDDPSGNNPPPNLIRNAFRKEPVHEWYYMDPADERQHTKAYEIMSCYEGLAEFWRVTGESRALDAAIRFADKIAVDEANAMGAVGFGDHFAHAAARHNHINEICDVIHWIRLCKELYEETDGERFLERMEFAFYNALLAGSKADGKWANHGVRSHGYGHFTSQHEVGMKYHECCVDNFPRIIETWERTAVREDKNGKIKINFFDDGRYRVSDGELRISGGYPANDIVNIELISEGDHEVEFRRPQWAKDMRVEGGGKNWRITFDMPVTVIHSSVAPNPDLKSHAAEVCLFCMSNFNNGVPDCPVRTVAGARIMKGPLILAKSARLGNTDGEIFDTASVNGQNVSAELFTTDDYGVWRLKLTTPDGSMTMPVCDFASAEDGQKAFSVWF